MITKKHLHIYLYAAIAVSAAFSSCSSDDDISSDDNKTEIVVISPADSIITAPFVTITNKYDLSGIKDKEISYSTEWSPLKGGFIEKTSNKKLKAGETSSSSTYNYLENDKQYKYITTLTSGNEQIFYKSLIYRVKFDEKDFVTTGKAEQGNEETTLKLSCKFNIPKEFRDKYDFLICYSTEPDMLYNKMETASGEVKCELDDNGYATVELKNMRLNNKYYYQAMIQRAGYAPDYSSWVDRCFEGLYCGEIKNTSTPDLKVNFTVGDIPKINYKGFVIPISATTSNGKNDRIQVGICYSSTNKLPTIENDEYRDYDDKDSKESDDFADRKITNLNTNTVYYYRPYVKYRYDEFDSESDSHTDDYCIVYGDVKTFKTPALNLAKGEVDLGLSVKWAGCNVGSSTPDGYGNYFTKSGEGYDANGDKVAELDIPEGWRLPTNAEWKELESKEVAYVCHNSKWGLLIENEGKQLFIPDNSPSADDKSTGGYWASDYSDAIGCGENGFYRYSIKKDDKRGVRLVKDKKDK
jgi:hypothetical protein